MKERSFEEWQAAFPGMFTNVRSGFDLPPGWTEIVWKGCKALQEFTTHRVHVHQVKEKFGGLRFYCSLERLPFPAGFEEGDSEWGWEYAVVHNEDFIERVIHSMEQASYWTCETCGTTTDVTVEGSWITTQCRPCRAKAHRQLRWENRWWRFRRVLRRLMRFWRKR